nr:hypothetical protein Itr_chr06CG13050 [Ipomoea trifida]
MGRHRDLVAKPPLPSLVQPLRRRGIEERRHAHPLGTEEGVPLSSTATLTRTVPRRRRRTGGGGAAATLFRFAVGDEDLRRYVWRSETFSGGSRRWCPEQLLPGEAEKTGSRRWRPASGEAAAAHAMSRQRRIVYHLAPGQLDGVVYHLAPGPVEDHAYIPVEAPGQLDGVGSWATRWCSLYLLNQKQVEDHAYIPVEAPGQLDGVGSWATRWCSLNQVFPIPSLPLVILNLDKAMASSSNDSGGSLTSLSLSLNHQPTTTARELRPNSFPSPSSPMKLPFLVHDWIFR